MNFSILSSFVFGLCLCLFLFLSSFVFFFLSFMLIFLWYLFIYFLFIISFLTCFYYFYFYFPQCLVGFFFFNKKVLGSSTLKKKWKYNIPYKFLIKKMSTFFVLFNKDIIVNLYKFYFPSSHFSSQPNKRVFYFSTFPSCKLNTHEGKLNIFYIPIFLPL